MIKHIVLYKFKKEYPDAAQQAAEKLMALPEKIDVIRSFEVGKDVLHEERSYDFALIGVFDSLEAMETYKKHPEHLKVREFMKEVREASVSVDFEF
ncbi:Dabb family protein [Clostridia bacterium OttesenSCG-928-F22]|nr:Dabb family protein [Clostridia bacterium OttesenSCG-928-F22]